MSASIKAELSQSILILYQIKSSLHECKFKILLKGCTGSTLPVFPFQYTQGKESLFRLNSTETSLKISRIRPYYKMHMVCKTVYRRMKEQERVMITTIAMQLSFYENFTRCCTAFLTNTTFCICTHLIVYLFKNENKGNKMGLYLLIFCSEQCYLESLRWVNSEFFERKYN